MLIEEVDYLKIVEGCFTNMSLGGALDASPSTYLEQLTADCCPDKAAESNVLFTQLLKNELKTDNDHIFKIIKRAMTSLKKDELREVACSLACDDQLDLGSNLRWITNALNSTSLTNYINYNSSVPQDVTKPELKVCLVNQWTGANIQSFRIIHDIITEKGYSIKEVSNSAECELVIDGIITSMINGELGYEKIKNPNAFKIFYTGEPQPARLEGYDLSLGFTYLPGQENYVRFPLYYLYYGELINTDFTRGECHPNKPYFACFLTSNGYNGDGAQARTHLFHSLSEYKQVTSGGKHLNNMGEVVAPGDTLEFLSQCKFVISYENSNYLPGYITEKPFQAYFAGAVPLYYSHPTALNDINMNAVVSAQNFKSEAEMINYIIEIDKDDKKYCDIWNQPLVTDSNRDYEVVKNKIQQKMENFLQINWLSKLKTDDEKLMSLLRINTAYSNNKPIKLIRHGSANDGGYVVPVKAFEAADALLGYGVKDDNEFEIRFSEVYNKPSFGFDCSIDGIASRNKQFTFIEECISDGVNKFFEKSATFDQQLNRLNLTDKKVMIKMDIESSEFLVMKDLLKHSDKITGIVLEMHYGSGWPHSPLKLLADLSEDFVLIHLHANNCVPPSYEAKNLKGIIPQIMELTFINKALVDNYHVAKLQKYPLAIDLPNCPLTKELEYEILY